jgi:hypothetical protein
VQLSPANHPSQPKAVPQLQLVRASTTSATLPSVAGLLLAARSTPCLTDHPSRETTATPALPPHWPERHTTSPSPCHRPPRAQARASTYPRKTTPTRPPTSPKWSSSKQRTRTCANACERSSELYAPVDVTAAPVWQTAARRTRLLELHGTETMVR